jgi:hypothetical protein
VKRFIIFTLCLVLTLAPVVVLADESATEDDENGEDEKPPFVWDAELDGYYPTTQYEPGRGKTMAIATAFGLVTGMVVGGLVLIFYFNPEADKNFDTVLMVTGALGFAGGIALGMTLPAAATREDAAASLRLDDSPKLNLRVPAVGVSFEQTPVNSEEFWRTNLFKLSF